MKRKRRRGSRPAGGAGAERASGALGGTPSATGAASAAEAPPAEWRGRPGRRTTEDRTGAVLALLSGNASVDQLAARYGVQPATVEGWRQLALESFVVALRQGTAKSAEQVKLERELQDLREAFTDLAIRHELRERALKERPSPPARSPR